MSGIKTYSQIDMRVRATEPTHVVTVKEMTDYVAGMSKAQVRVILTAPFDGVYDPVEKTLTQAVAEELVIDGVTLDLNDRVLVTGQADKTQNGIYVVTVLGEDDVEEAVLTRAEDFSKSTDVINGLTVPIEEGEINAGTKWKLAVGALPIVMDSTTFDFAKDVVDFTKVVEAPFAIEGDDTAKDYVFEHNLGTLNITHEAYEEATGETVIIPPLKRIDLNTVGVGFAAPLGVGNDLVLILRAQVDPL